MTAHYFSIRWRSTRWKVWPSRWFLSAASALQEVRVSPLADAGRHIFGGRDCTHRDQGHPDLGRFFWWILWARSSFAPPAPTDPPNPTHQLVAGTGVVIYVIQRIQRILAPELIGSPETLILTKIHQDSKTLFKARVLPRVDGLSHRSTAEIRSPERTLQRSRPRCLRGRLLFFS